MIAKTFRCCCVSLSEISFLWIFSLHSSHSIGNNCPPPFYFWSQEENYYGKPCADVLSCFFYWPLSISYSCNDNVLCKDFLWKGGVTVVSMAGFSIFQSWNNLYHHYALQFFGKRNCISKRLNIPVKRVMEFIHVYFLYQNLYSTYSSFSCIQRYLF